MSLPQLIGLQCVVCQKSIASILDGAFCEDCGNPVHRKCIGSVQQTAEERCQLCGGDANDTIAREVRRDRIAQAQVAQVTGAGGGTATYPISKKCPNCGYAKFRRERPQAWVSFDSDRVCTQCGTRYTPPTPLWAALVFLLIGVLLAGFGGVSIFFRLASGNPLAIPGMLCEGFAAMLGILAIVQGIRSLASPGKA